MGRTTAIPPRGVLRRGPEAAPFQLARRPPPPDLALFVELWWTVSWDLRGREPHVQETLPHPSVHLVIERGRSEVVGVLRERFTRVLDGAGTVLGVKFRPGGFHPFLRAPMTTLTDRRLPLAAVIPGAGAMEEEVLAAEGHDEREAVAARHLRAMGPERDPVAEQVARIVEAAAGDPALTRVETLARRHGIGVRRLQRLFAEYVGVGPKWVLRRYRLHEAAERAAAGTVDWAGLATELGYTDQAHLVRDFTAAVGVPPGRYAAAQRQGAAAPTREGRPVS